MEVKGEGGNSTTVGRLGQRNNGLNKEMNDGQMWFESSNISNNSTAVLYLLRLSLTQTWKWKVNWPFGTRFVRDLEENPPLVLMRLKPMGFGMTTVATPNFRCATLISISPKYINHQLIKFRFCIVLHELRRITFLQPARPPRLQCCESLPAPPIDIKHCSILHTSHSLLCPQRRHSLQCSFDNSLHPGFERGIRALHLQPLQPYLGHILIHSDLHPRYRYANAMQSLHFLCL